MCCGQPLHLTFPPRDRSMGGQVSLLSPSHQANLTEKKKELLITWRPIQYMPNKASPGLMLKNSCKIGFFFFNQYLINRPDQGSVNGPGRVYVHGGLKSGHIPKKIYTIGLTPKTYQFKRSVSIARAENTSSIVINDKMKVTISKYMLR